MIKKYNLDFKKTINKIMVLQKFFLLKILHILMVFNKMFILKGYYKKNN
jgi:hypothetical protein